MNLRGLYGGCPGSAGGVAKSQAQATAGHGGGAVLIIASTLELDGSIDAGGSGGGGGDAAAGSFNAYLSGGGGGGGAGGLIALEIGALTGVGSVAANGGGGGGGGQVKAIGSGFTAGQPGEDSAQSGSVCALGGNGGTSGGAGGCGTAPAHDGVGSATVDALNYDSGGGGGGAVGIILSTVPVANASPPTEMM